MATPRVYLGHKAEIRSTEGWSALEGRQLAAYIRLEWLGQFIDENKLDAAERNLAKVINEWIKANGVPIQPPSDGSNTGGG